MVISGEHRSKANPLLQHVCGRPWHKWLILNYRMYKRQEHLSNEAFESVREITGQAYERMMSIYSLLDHETVEPRGAVVVPDGPEVLIG
jgi:hypothetical protein